MKKRKLLTTILGILCLSLVQTNLVQASDSAQSSADNVAVINFYNIDKNVMDRNMTVKYNNNTLLELSDNYGDLVESIDGMKSNLDNLNSSIQIYQDTQKNVLDTLKNSNDTDTKNMASAVSDVYTYLINTLQKNASSLQGQMDNTTSNAKSSYANLVKTNLQLTMANNQIAWGAESLYFSYNDINVQIETNKNNLSSLNNQLKILQTKQKLGMASEEDITSLQSKIRDLNNSIDTLTKQQANIKKDINIQLGQDYDTPLTIEGYPDINSINIETRSFDKDYAIAISNSYNIKLQDNTATNEGTSIERDKLNDEKRKFKETFSKAFQDVKDKNDTVEIEKSKLQDEQITLNIVKLKYNLGMKSRIDVDNENVNYMNQQVKVNQAQNDLFKSYRKYQWILKGLTL